ncbi:MULTISPECIES: PilZ domain-containing protein [Comamonas]|uniref:Cyclic diguanosine monophosphate-binding protein n=1 Tax=Comamonas flocculans TaxID=2597701 RepID=A0A5B8RYD8_9BURK|nr:MULTISPECIES: PilZ domain-containing protein [Comamonas]QEA13698.1 PilZ domain-containing protein [Comamonas flocculans]QXL85735.1 PilZ domain-containing protein [Comamonas sp. NLF-1-9]
MPYERRHYVRVRFDSPGQLRWAGQAVAVRVLDLSLKGALLQTALDRTALQPGLRCELTVPLAPQEYIRMAVEVTHLQEEHIGVACLSVDIDSVTHLRRLIELQLGDPALLERDLAELSGLH